MTTTLGYRLVIPREWHKIPVQRGSDQAVRALLDRAFAKHGRDEVAQYRRELERRLLGLVGQSRQNAGVDLYLPFGRPGRNLPASFLVSFVEFGSAQAPTPQQVLTDVLRSTGGEPVEVAGTSGLRSERVYAADASRGVDHPTRRVEYVLPAPGTADGWLVSSFSTVGEGDPEDRTALLLCALFDAIMSTFRWTGQQQEADA